MSFEAKMNRARMEVDDWVAQNVAAESRKMARQAAEFALAFVASEIARSCQKDDDLRELQEGHVELDRLNVPRREREPGHYALLTIKGRIQLLSALTTP